ncbi:MAG: hypothetical protein HFG49_09355 [Lachnospiraceae bacterium]|jgi:hypothetical protein|nr:hypothetical protein [Lachnospiraceae bacterium]
MKAKQTFLVHIVESQNATWQGNVTWLNQEKTENFRSLLELIKLMDAAVDHESHEEEEKPQPAK